MPAALKKQLDFASPPRTGTIWFCQAAALAGFDIPHHNVHRPERTSRSLWTATCVRHPYYWLCSYYRALRGGSIGIETLDALVPTSRRSEGLEAFLHNYLDNHPGQVGRIFAEYDAMFWLPVERLPEATAELFGLFDVPKDVINRIRHLPPTNALKGSPHPKFTSVYDAVMRAERDYCEHYEYW